MAKRATKEATTTEPKFPYTPSPGSLRKFLKLVPGKPKPPKITVSLLRGWGLTSSNDRYLIPILRALNFISSSGEPTENYEAFMQRAAGPATLGAQIRRVYAPLFQASHQPHKDSHEDQKRLFNIHSGGSDRTIRYQIETFKALCEFATFEDISGGGAAPLGAQLGGPTEGPSSQRQPSGGAGPAIHIDLHIHLPENRSTREYEAIIQDIARYIYKQEVTPDGQ